jgi:tripeptide aminopeptidase
MPTIALDAAERRDLLGRFLRYVRIDTQSDENSTASPSTEKQKDLARLLVEELKQLGCADATVDEWGYVFATVPSNLPAAHSSAGKVVPVIGLVAHMDTYHGTLGAGVSPQVIESYQGGDIALPGDPRQVIRFSDNPNLAKCVGHTIVTSDGTTLLGADDKAGIAEIMTAVAWLGKHPEFAHGAVRVGFTTDEEVGHGTDHFDVAAFGAAYAYTLDGSDIAEIEDETFCADSALVVIEGHDVHPGYAKGKLVNAVRVAAAIVERLPREFLPETTELRQPYLHPYDLRGDVTRVEIKLLVRAFTEAELRGREDSLKAVVREVQGAFPEARISVEVKESYRNMAYKISEDPKVLEYAFEAVRRLGLDPVRRAIRGGTDGSRLSFMGLLTPNIWAGGQNFHSVQEWVSLGWMAKACEVTLHLLQVWVERSAA